MVFDIDIQKRYRKYYKHPCLGGFCCSCSVAANHEALSRLRHGFKSRREHSYLLHIFQLVTVLCPVFSVVLSSDVNLVAGGIIMVEKVGGRSLSYPSERQDLPSVLFRQHLCECRVHGGQSADDSDHSRDVRDGVVPQKVRRGQHEEGDRQGQEHELE